MANEITFQPQRIESADEAVTRAALYANKIHANLSDKSSPTVQCLRSANVDVLIGDDSSGYKEQLRAKLTGKDYWMVHYKPSLDFHERDSPNKRGVIC